jgi:branched-subunit amino acid ABC-type transport system permease component
VIQVLFDSLIYTSELALMSIGVTMVYGALRFPNFAHVEFATIGAYLALVLAWFLNMHVALAALVGLAAAGLAGVVVDRLVFVRLRRSTPIILMITSFAVGIVLRSTVRAIWGSSPHFYPLGLQIPYEVLGANITPVQLIIILVAVVCMFGFYVLLNKTRLGIAMRATADNAALAEACGIYTERVIMSVWFIGCAFAGLAGVLIGLDTQIHPNMGFGIIIPVFCAAILGGIGSPFGAVLGSAIVAFAQNIGLSINWAPVFGLAGLTSAESLYIPTGYKEAIPFLILILVLLKRPQGLMGDASR